MAPTQRPETSTVGADDAMDSGGEAQSPGLADAALIASPEAVAGSFGEYASAWIKRVRGGESGILPVLGGLVIIVLIFQSQSSVFLSAGNLTNLLEQSATFVLLGMAEVFVLLLGEIDLSVGYVAGIGAVVTAELLGSPYNFPWWLAILCGVVATALIGALQGALITRLHLPSFVVTLAGLLFWEGALIYLVNHASNGTGGTIRISNHVIDNLVSGTLDPVAGWVIMVVAVALYAVFTVTRERHRRASGLVSAPFALTVIKVVVMAVAGVVLVVVCNTNRGVLVPLRGVPWVVPIVVAFTVGWTFLLGRTRYGRYVYSIGGNAEAARRAGISLTRIRLLAFSLAGLTAGAAGIIYASRLQSISNNVDGGTLVLYAVAAAVIGGTSLFGGRGKIVHALIGGLIIATIYNGMGLLGMSAAAQYMVTALVLLAAVTVDALARRGATTA